MASRNDITGDEIKTRALSDAYRANYDNVFKSREPEPNILGVVLGLVAAFLTGFILSWMTGLSCQNM